MGTIGSPCPLWVLGPGLGRTGEGCGVGKGPNVLQAGFLASSRQGGCAGLAWGTGGLGI